MKVIQDYLRTTLFIMVFAVVKSLKLEKPLALFVNDQQRYDLFNHKNSLYRVKVTTGRIKILAQQYVVDYLLKSFKDIKLKLRNVGNCKQLRLTPEYVKLKIYQGSASNEIHFIRQIFCESIDSIA